MKNRVSSLLPIKLVLKNVASVKKQMGFLFWTSTLSQSVLGWGSPAPVGGPPGQGQSRGEWGGEGDKKNPLALPSHITSPVTRMQETGMLVTRVSSTWRGPKEWEYSLTHPPPPPRKRAPPGWSRGIQVPLASLAAAPLSFSLVPGAHSSSHLSSPSTRVTQ